MILFGYKSSSMSTLHNDDGTLLYGTKEKVVLPVNVELEEKTPPDILWHGTGEKYDDSIDAQGLIPKSRLYVHLSSDKENAKKVGSRHGRPVIYEIDCCQMAVDGYQFFESANHVWLTKEVPGNCHAAREAGSDCTASQKPQLRGKAAV